MNGFITLDKKILGWQWYNSPNESRLFIHLLLKANFTEGLCRTTVVKRGQLVTSASSLATQLKMTEKQVRGALERLQKSGEIEYKGTNKFTLITIVKYNEYQNRNSKKGEQKVTQKGEQKGKQRGNDINKRNKKESITISKNGELSKLINNAVQYYGEVSPDSPTIDKVFKQLDADNWQYKGVPVDENNYVSYIVNFLGL